MKLNELKVKDFIKINADIDVYDDVCEEIAICFCGCQELTEEGKKHFAEVLEYDMELDLSGDFATAIVKVDSDDDKVWRRKLRKAKDFFCSAAGYCADTDYQKWFCEMQYGQYATDPDTNIYMTVYCDTTPWYTEEEMNADNLCDLSFPRKMVREFYDANKADCIADTMKWTGCDEEDATFERWLTEVYTADSTNELFQFCEDRGFIAWREH